MAIDETKWPIPAHTRAKHAILKRYMDAWIPIMSSAFGKIVYIDAFAGPGEYENGEDGSPIIVIKAAENHFQQWRGSLYCLFIEERDDRANNLIKLLKSTKVKRKITWDVVTGDCNNVINTKLDVLDRRGLKIAPTFALLDPFGYNDVSYKFVKRLLDNDKCEVFVTVMIEGIVRNIPIKVNEENITKFFGSEEWKKAQKLDTKDKIKFLHDLYTEQLKRTDISKRVFVRSFEMRNTVDKTSYYLFYATKHPLGLEKMKDAMWKVDTKGTFQFSDITDPKQTVLFTLDETNILERELINQFKGKAVSIEEIEQFVIQETAFLKTHIRKTLNKMEYSKQPKIQVPIKRRKGTYPTRTIIKFNISKD